MSPGKKIAIYTVLIACIIAAIGTYFYIKPMDLNGYEHKLWAHRCNTPQEARDAISKFNGIELDIVYNDTLDRFEVYHPPQPFTGVLLSDYEDFFTDNPEIGVWLDFKNLTMDNMKASHQRLLSHNFTRTLSRKRILIESNYYHALRLFQESGFQISYYLPQNYRSSTTDYKKQIRQSIDTALRILPGIHLSTNYLDYTEIRNAYPEAKIHVWMLENYWDRDQETVQKMLEDTQVGIVLIKHRTLGKSLLNKL